MAKNKKTAKERVTYKPFDFILFITVLLLLGLRNNYGIIS